jgi:hypothetical protein
VSDTLAGVPALSQLRYAQLTPGETFGPFVEPLALTTSDALPLLTLRVLRRALDGIVPGGVLTRQRFVIHAELPATGDVEADVLVSAQHRAAAGLFTTFTFTLRHAGRLCAVVEWSILDPA